MIQNSVAGIGVKLSGMDVIFDATAPNTVTKPLATPIAFSYLKGVNRNGFNTPNSTKTARNKYGHNNEIRAVRAATTATKRGDSERVICEFFLSPK